MAKVYPETQMISSSNLCYLSSERTVFTLWMKSLVMHSNGCTVFGSRGEVVYRVDNYQTRRCSEIFLMNVHGEVLYSIKRKKLAIFETVEGCKWENQNDVEQCFRVERKCKLFGRDNSSCNIIQGNDVIPGNFCKIVGSEGKSTFKIMDREGRIMAEVTRKESAAAGVSLGNDVLSLRVEPEVDQSLVMALVIAHGMVNHTI